MSGMAAGLRWWRPGIDAFPAMLHKLGASHLFLLWLQFLV